MDKIQEMTAVVFSCLTQDTRPETQPAYLVSKFSAETPNNPDWGLQLPLTLKMQFDPSERFKNTVGCRICYPEIQMGKVL